MDYQTCLIPLRLACCSTCNQQLKHLIDSPLLLVRPFGYLLVPCLKVNQYLVAVWNHILQLSGRSAILGYTMPMFSAVLGALFFGNRLPGRAWAGVGAATLGVVLLLWHEITNLSGRPLGVLLALVAASTWALGTQLLRRTKMPVPTLAISFWMTAMTTVVLTVLAVVFEQDRWIAPSPTHWGSIVFNAVLVFGFAHAAWFYLARSLPPVASTLSVMLIPVVGVFSGSLVLGEVLHWQDWAAVVLMVVSIAAVLWPARQPT